MTTAGQAQAVLAETKVKQLGELVEVEAVETFWRSKLNKTFRNRVLAIPHRIKDLSARQNVMLSQELRDALEELANA